jgi:lipopolysaccharide biosynthesis protein
LSRSVIPQEIAQLIDEEWYLETYPDVASAGIPAQQHYMSTGWAEGRKPNPFFDTEWYFRTYRDVEEAGVNPLAHYVRAGWREGRDPHPQFNTRWYLESYADVAQSGMNPLRHYLSVGASEGRIAHSPFDVAPPQLNGATPKPQNHGASGAKLGVYEGDNAQASDSLIALRDNSGEDCRFSGKLAVHLHLFHAESADAFRTALRNIPYDFDLLVSVPSADVADTAKRKFSGIGRIASLSVETVPNVGRDIAPMLVQFGQRLMAYDLLIHIHSKKSQHNASKLDWAAQMLDHLLRSKGHVTSLLNTFADRPKLGLAFPVYHASVRTEITWGSNFAPAQRVMRHLGQALTESDLSAFPAGSFFIARTDALRDILDLDFRKFVFEPEEGRVDGTLAHAIERLWPIVAKRRGFSTAQLRAETHQPARKPARGAAATVTAPARQATDAAYAALRQEVLESGLWNEKWYLSHYYEQFRESKNRRPRDECFFPLDYYLQEGWKLGHEPSELLPLQIDEKSVGCSKLEYFLKRLRFDGYQFDANIWIPSDERIETYTEQKRKRNATKVMYTCIAQGYDVLMQPYFIADDWDYVCFTDDEALVAEGTVGVWDVRPMVEVRASGVRTNRWHKMHPHKLFPLHEESIYVDGNINIISSYLFDQIETRDTPILLPQHFIRNCVYQEIEILLNRAVTSEEDKALLSSHRQFMQKEGFPEGYGLGENNVIYRRHHDPLILKMMDDWWTFYSTYSSRDQASLAYVFWKNGLSLRDRQIPNCRINFRDFWVMKHCPDMPAAALPKPVATSSNAKIPSLSPAFERDNIGVVFSTNETFIPYLGIAVYSLIQNTNPTYNYDIIILSSGIPDAAFAKVVALADGHDNVSIRLYDTTPLINSIPKELFHVEGYVPVETYNKCFITEILTGYDRCAYLDSDILVVGDVQELHDIDLKGRAIGASVNVANVNAAYCKKVIKGRQFDEYLTQDLGVLDHTRYFQAGVVVLDMKRLYQMDLRSRTLETLRRVPKPIFFDQCIFNSIFYDDVHFFSTRWNHVWYMQQYSYLRGSVPDEVFFDYASARTEPKIIHYAGKDKPQSKLGWVLSDHFWKYAYASPFFDDIKQDVVTRGTEVAEVITASPDSDWYRVKSRLLVHVHLYYHDQVEVMLQALSNISQCDVDLFVTVVENDPAISKRILSQWKDAHILLLPNVGYDVYPFLHVLNQVRLADYDFILKLHTKNARQPGQDEVYNIKVPGYQWRDELINALLGSREIFEQNLERLVDDKSLGCLGAGQFIFSTEENNEERNYSLAEWRERCGLTGGTHYVGGSMFLARAYPFERLKSIRIRPQDFEAKQMATKDHKNKAHIFERLLGLVVENEGFEIRGA